MVFVYFLLLVDLVLSNVFYFGCQWLDVFDVVYVGQFYVSQIYVGFFGMLECLLCVLCDGLWFGGWLVLCVENLWVGEQFVLLVWDLVWLMVDCFCFVEECILVYDCVSMFEMFGQLCSNCLYEYVLIVCYLLYVIDMEQIFVVL